MLYVNMLCVNMFSVNMLSVKILNKCLYLKAVCFYIAIFVSAKLPSWGAVQNLVRAVHFSNCTAQGQYTF